MSYGGNYLHGVLNRGHVYSRQIDPERYDKMLMISSIFTPPYFLANLLIIESIILSRVFRFPNVSLSINFGNMLL